MSQYIPALWIQYFPEHWIPILEKGMLILTISIAVALQLGSIYIIGKLIGKFFGMFHPPEEKKRIII